MDSKSLLLVTLSDVPIEPSFDGLFHSIWTYIIFRKDWSIEGAGFSSNTLECFPTTRTAYLVYWREIGLRVKFHGIVSLLVNWRSFLKFSFYFSDAKVDLEI